jgi:hypothetical protein
VTAPSVPGEAILRQIQQLLRDRYATGFPILKELIQNADDGKAERLLVAVQGGWPNSSNPLLRHPGLIVINDGQFTERDEVGVCSFSNSGKTSDATTIGKFGLGQKAVFHLCDAFLMLSHGTEHEFFETLNPFLGLQSYKTAASGWEIRDPSDRERLVAVASEHGFKKCRVILWIPFRTRELQLGPGIGITSARPNGDSLLVDFDRPDDIVSTLAILRRLKRVQIVGADGATVLDIEAGSNNTRLTGPAEVGDALSGRFQIKRRQEAFRAAYAGLETVSRDPRFDELKIGEHWPSTFHDGHTEPRSEKGEPHGAVVVTSVRPGKAGALHQNWAVFVPVGEPKIQMLGSSSAATGDVGIVLHGFFFVDSGRRYIEGIDKPGTIEQISDDASLRQAWNRRIRDYVTLPLLPRALALAIKTDVIPSRMAAEIVRVVGDADWFRLHKRAACAQLSLVRILKPDLSTEWDTVSAQQKLRFLPSAALAEPERLSQLFPRLHEWAESQGIVLAVDPSSSLVAAPQLWSSAEIVDLLGQSPASTFTGRASANLLATVFEVLRPIALGPDPDIGRALLKLLRAAMSLAENLAASETIARILAYVPSSLTFALPKTVERKAIHRALAESISARFAIRSEWASNEPEPPLEVSDVRALLEALEPLIVEVGEEDEEASLAALSVLAKSKAGLEILTNDPDVATLRVLRAYDVVLKDKTPQSIRDLAAAARSGLVFRRRPGQGDPKPILEAVAAALPQARPLLLDGGTLRQLDDGTHKLIAIADPDRAAVLRLIQDATDFGEPSARLALVGHFRPEIMDPPRTWRMFCAGNCIAATETAYLFALKSLPPGASAVEDIVTRLLAASERSFLVPGGFLDVLVASVQAKLGIKSLGVEDLGALLLANAAALSNLGLSRAEREAFVSANLPDDTLGQLPIHDRSDGTIGPISGHVFHVEAAWPVPDAMKPLVLQLVPFDSRECAARQKRLVSLWSSSAQIACAFGRPQPASYQKDIISALETLEALGDDLVASLRTRPWLTASGNAFGFEELMDLSSEVETAARNLPTPPDFHCWNDLDNRPAVIPILDRHRGALCLSRSDSNQKLLDSIQSNAAVGLPGCEGAPAAQDAKTLADANAIVASSGWPLIACLLRESADDVRMVELATKFSGPIAAADLGKCLDSLAELCRPGQTGEAARRLYKLMFATLRSKSNDERHVAFSETRVPTCNGELRQASSVIEHGAGVAASHLLATDYAHLLGRARGEGQHAELAASQAYTIEEIPEVSIASTSLADIETEFFDHLDAYLAPWEGKVPGNLMMLLIGLLGRQPAACRVAARWRSTSSTDFRNLWEDMDGRFQKHFDKVTLSGDIADRRYQFVNVEGERLEVHSLTGGLFSALRDDDQSTLLVGNLYKNRRRLVSDTGQVVTLIPVPLRSIDADAYSPDEARKAITQLTHDIARSCVDLGLSHYRVTLDELIGDAGDTGQATLRDVRLGLEYSLERILRELKLPRDSATKRALAAYNDDLQNIRQLHGNKPDAMFRIGDLNRALWEAVQNPAIQVETLAALRERIASLGYSDRSVLFELMQNADDAYHQLSPEKAGRFRLVWQKSNDNISLRIIHWGRAVNHLGADPKAGQALGYARDLENMLQLNLSEKRDGDELTGKFGLGFKSIHTISDHVGIVSGFLSLRVEGGLLPVEWPEGSVLGNEFRGDDGQAATIIDLPASRLRSTAPKSALEAFTQHLLWLPLFTRNIRTIEIAGETLTTAHCAFTALAGLENVRLARLTADRVQRVLHFDLGAGFMLAIGIDSFGPHALPESLPRVWNLAPLSERVAANWLINGPFAVDPGRSGLTEAERQRLRPGLASRFGQALIALHDIAENDWAMVAGVLELSNDLEARDEFWRRLFNIFYADHRDAYATGLHSKSCGYGRLISERQVLPALPDAKSTRFLKASEARYALTGAANDPDILQAVSLWPNYLLLEPGIVSDRTAEFLRGTSIADPISLSLGSLIAREMEDGNKVPAEVAVRIGAVVNKAALEKYPLLPEKPEIVVVAGRSLFLLRDGNWATAKAVVSETAEDEDERLIAAFAPPSNQLDASYGTDCLEFFGIARSQSGYAPTRYVLGPWAAAARSIDQQRGVLQYLLRGRNSTELVIGLRDPVPFWFPADAHEWRVHPATDGFSAHQIDEIIRLLGSASETPPTDYPPAIQLDSEELLRSIHDWWEQVRDGLVARYESDIYPAFFDREGLISDNEAVKRITWFTMFALATFHSIGRTVELQHRGFIDAAWKAGWWQEIATSPPPDDIGPWLARLEDWASPDLIDQSFVPWRRMFVDLYTIARHLPAYIAVFERLPEIVRDKGQVGFLELLQPAQSSVYARMSLEAAPIRRSLGIGVNWLIRELLRLGVYGAGDTNILAPYGFAATRRLRNLLSRLGHVIPSAEPESSAGIYGFIAGTLDAASAAFCGDLDLPLQLITHKRHVETLAELAAINSYEVGNILGPDDDSGALG